MRYSDLAQDKLAEAKNLFGSYAYGDKGADEVMDVGELVTELKKLPIPDMIAELKHLADRADCALDPTILVRSILGSLDSDSAYDALFEDEDLAEHY
jgi:hypothetical protein